VAGDRGLAGRVGVRAAYRAEGLAGREEWHDGKPVPLGKGVRLGAAVGSETAVDLELLPTGIFGRPGRYRVYVRHALKKPSQATNWQEADVVVAHPFELRVR